MGTLFEIAPDFAAEVRDALKGVGRSSLAATLVAIEIGNCSYDDDTKMGYIKFVWSDPGYSAELAAPVKETIPFPDPQWFNVDVDHDDRLFGIELDGRADVIALLRTANAL